MFLMKTVVQEYVCQLKILIVETPLEIVHTLPQRTAAPNVISKKIVVAQQVLPPYVGLV